MHLSNKVLVFFIYIPLIRPNADRPIYYLFLSLIWNEIPLSREYASVKTLMNPWKTTLYVFGI
jgi:hypothetical protein